MRKQISAETFIKICNGPYDIQSNSEFYSRAESGPVHVTFENYDIIEDIRFRGGNIPVIFLNGCNSKDIYFDKGCSVQQLNISKDSKIGNVFLINQSRISVVGVHKSQVGTMLLSDGTTSRVELTDAKSGGLSFLKLKVKVVQIENSWISDILVMDAQIGKATFRFTTLGDCNIVSSVVSTLSFDQSRVYKLRLSSLPNELSRLTVSNSNLNYLVTETSNELDLIVNENSIIYYLYVNNYILSSKVRLHISDTDINSIQLEHFINNGLLVFNNIKPLTKLYPFKERAQGGLNGKPVFSNNDFLFEEIDQKSSINIVNSDLGNTQITSCDFRSFDEFLFQNSKMVDVFIADTSLPRSETVITLGLEGNEIHVLEQKRLVFNQFKKIYERQGDLIRASIHLAEELELYRQQLKLQAHTERKDRWNRRAELFSLWLNRYSNYYGNNWLRALVMTIAVNSILFTCYCWSLGYNLGGDLSLFFRLFSYSFEFLNPLRKAEFLLGENAIPPVARVIDYISRIAVAYFVYQTIQAFRKLGRRTL